MSGVAGADRVRSRQDFDHFIQDYKRLISLFPGFVSMTPSGSYNSNPDKQDFGDIDLIVHISSNLSKADVKKQLQAFFMKEPETKIVPFSSEKHAGKRTYNAGELVSVRYHDDALGYSAQIDNIIALDHNEAGFKQQFLDWPAEKQGLILGLVKVATIETDPSKIFRSLGIQVNTNIEANQEYEFNLSSVRIELRLSTYDPELLKQGTYKTIKSEVVWQSQNFDDLKKILWQYDLDDDFAGLVAQAKQTVKNPRSPQRIKGVFASMITVKSGEVGTAKGAGKEAALAKINQTFSETRSLFRALVEADDQRRVVFAFVRFQPPTIGHDLLITTVKQTAEENDCPYAIYVSKTQDHKKNPLSIEQKMQYLNKLFPGTNFVAAGATTRTPIEAAKALNGKFNDLILVAGSDRANLRDTLEAYNHKEYDYNSIDFVSAGERDPDADDITGVSGTNIRQMALDGDYESFKSNLPGSADDATAEQLMRDIQAGMTKPARAKKTGENRDLQGTDVTWKRGMSGSAYPQTYHNTGHTGGVAEGSEQSLLSMVNQDQSERNEYKNFVKSQAGGDWSKGAKMYAQIKKRPSNDIFGDASRLNQFMKMKFDFDKFTDEDWDNYWLLAQHCDDNRNFQKNALSIIKKYQGTDHSHYKYLYDRISMGLTGKQKYGTQNTIKQGVAEGVEQKYLWHGSTQEIPVLTPRQATDTGGAKGSNQNAIYATDNPDVAIAMGMTERGSDTAMFPNDPQMVLFKGRIRNGQNVYLHKLPKYDADGKPLFIQHGGEWYSRPNVKELKPIEIIPEPVDQHLNLIRQATTQDLELQKKYMKKQGVAEGLEQINEYRDRLLQYVKSLLPTWPEYVLKDWLVPNKGDFSNLPDDALKKGIMEKVQGAGLTTNTKWQLIPNMKFTMDMFNPKTKQLLIGRAGGSSDLGMGIPKDKERHTTQAALAQQQGGIRKEPVILIKSTDGYELLEGWHRTIQHFVKYPDGYTGPAYVAVAQGQQGVAEGKLNELFNPNSSYPIETKKIDFRDTEVSATTQDGRKITCLMRYDPRLQIKIMSIDFNVNGQVQLTGQGDATKILTTVVEAVKKQVAQIDPEYLIFLADSQHQGIYSAMARRLGGDYQRMKYRDAPAIFKYYTQGIDPNAVFILHNTTIEEQGVAEGKMNQLSRDMVDLSGPEFSQEYGNPKSSFQAPTAGPKISPQFDLSRVPPGFPQPPWDLNTVKAYWRLKNIPGNPAAAWQRGYRGPIKKQVPIGEELESIMAGLISIIESKHGRT